MYMDSFDPVTFNPCVYLILYPKTLCHRDLNLQIHVQFYFANSELHQEVATSNSQLLSS